MQETVHDVGGVHLALDRETRMCGQKMEISEEGVAGLECHTSWGLLP